MKSRRMGAYAVSTLAALMFTLPTAVLGAGLGKLTISSALGQPLAAEIDLLSVTPEEASSLNVRMATSEAFRDARVDPAPILLAIRFSVEQRADGKHYLKLSSTKPITDPFLDMVVELNWAGGRLLREYTVLLDPPGKAEAQSVPPLSPASPVTPAAVAPAAPKVEPKAEAKASPAASEPSAPQPAESGSTYTVKRGDSLGKIARQVKPEGVSLEQAMLGLYEANAQAFTGKNMNQLQQGRIMQLPDKDTLSAIDPQRAKREVALHTRNWSGYRDRLAGSVEGQRAQGGSTASGAAAGKITARVDDKSAPPVASDQDVLKLSKGETSSGKGGANVRALQERIANLEEDLTARGKDLEEKNQRVAMLEKNLEEMRKLLEMQKQAAAVAPGPPAPAEAPVPAPAPAAPAPAPEVKATPAPVPAPAPEPAAQPDSGGIFTNPLYLGGGLAAILAGWLGWMVIQGRRRKKGLASFEDSIMTGGDLKASTLFGSQAKGGAVDTGSTSFLTEFSQAGLGAIDTHDVDPIAEADVYMAYGRDAQAEEILKEAMLKDPGRHELSVKLLEIYAARKNAPAFEAVASELYAALGGKPSSLWDKAAEMGRQLDPNNPLYGAQVAGGVAQAMDRVTEFAPVQDVAAGEPEPVPEEQVTPAAEAASPEAERADDAALDFDMAFDMGDAAPAEVVEEAPAARDAENLLDFTLDETPVPETVPAQAAMEETAEEVLSFDMPDDLVMPEAPASAEASGDIGDTDGEAPETAPDMAAGSGEPALDLDFDFPVVEDDASGATTESAGEMAEDVPLASMTMPDLDLELGDDTTSSAAPESPSWDEVATKLDLARAYLEMGDREGAREILQEVLAEGDELQRGEAGGLLSGLG